MDLKTTIENHKRETFKFKYQQLYPKIFFITEDDDWYRFMFGNVNNNPFNGANGNQNLA